MKPNLNPASNSRKSEMDNPMRKVNARTVRTPDPRSCQI